eukprot:4102950-Prymnesium_polylepis.1
MYATRWKRLAYILACALLLLLLFLEDDGLHSLQARPTPITQPALSARRGPPAPTATAAARQPAAVLMLGDHDPWSTTALRYASVCAAINVLYARRHGLDFLWYRVAAAGDGSLRFRGRHVAWARVPAIAHAIARYRT